MTNYNFLYITHTHTHCIQLDCHSSDCIGVSSNDVVMVTLSSWYNSQPGNDPILQQLIWDNCIFDNEQNKKKLLKFSEQGLNLFLLVYNILFLNQSID